jgi:hypothetical protein
MNASAGQPPQVLERRCHFHSCACAWAGHIRRPNDGTIPGRVSVALPSTGGEAQQSGSYPDPQFNDTWGHILTVGASTALAKGDFTDLQQAATFTHGNHADNNVPMAGIARATLDDIKVVNQGPTSIRTLTARSLRAELQSGFENTEPGFSIIAQYEDVQIDGSPVTLTVDTSIFNGAGRTRTGLGQSYANDASFRQKLNRQLGKKQGVGGPPNDLDSCEVAGRLCCSVVNQITWNGNTTQGNRLVVPDFGVIYFGELYINRFTRRLTLMRIQLGSPDGGDLALGDVETDGHSIPP